MKDKFLAIEPIQQQGFNIRTDTADKVVIEIPLIKNRNDKGTMFAGMIYSGMVLTGWRLVENYFSAQGLHGDVVIKEDKAQYIRPVSDTLFCSTELNNKPFVTPSGNRGLDLLINGLDKEGNSVATLAASYRFIPK